MQDMLAWDTDDGIDDVSGLCEKVMVFLQLRSKSPRSQRRRSHPTLLGTGNRAETVPANVPAEVGQLLVDALKSHFVRCAGKEKR